MRVCNITNQIQTIHTHTQSILFLYTYKLAYIEYCRLTQQTSPDTSIVSFMCGCSGLYCKLSRLLCSLLLPLDHQHLHYQVYCKVAGCLGEIGSLVGCNSRVTKPKEFLFICLHLKKKKSNLALFCAQIFFFLSSLVAESEKINILTRD